MSSAIACPGVTAVNKIVLGLSTFPDAETARRISSQLVADRLIACANILPAIESIYRWKGEIETGPEVLVLFKTSEDRCDSLQEKLRELHPYELPELVFLPIINGLPDYLQWVIDNCG